MSSGLADASDSEAMMRAATSTRMSRSDRPCWFADGRIVSRTAPRSDLARTRALTIIALTRTSQS
jgi:hypothetical protein